MSWGRPQARSPLGRLRPPTQASLEFAAKAGVSVALAMSLSSAIGLHDRWWAGISAIVATADTIGASMGAAVLRIAATVVGLLVGLVPVALSAHGFSPPAPPCWSRSLCCSRCRSTAVRDSALPRR